MKRRSRALRPAIFATFVAFVAFASRAEARPEGGGAACVQASEEGLAARERGALLLARERFIACAADACGKSLRVDCARWLDEVVASTPSVVMGAKDAQGADVFDVKVLVDGEPALGHEAGRAVSLDPGPHVVRFERVGASPVTLKVLLRAGEKNRAVIATFPAPAPQPIAPRPPVDVKRDDAPKRVPTATWIFGGIGLAALGSFAYFGGTGLAEKDRLRGTCSPRCTSDDVGTLRTQYIAADISLAVGVVALGVATLFFIRD